MSLADKVKLPLFGTKVLIFDVEDIRRLRELTILGVLTGTLPVAPQQNIFLGVPLQLSIYETLWLIKMGHGVLIDGVYYNKVLTSNKSAIQDMISPNSDDYLLTKNTTESENLKYIDIHDLVALYCTSEEEKRKLRLNYIAFKKLKEMNYFILPGIRFGCQFLAYPGDPLRYHSHLMVMPNIQGIKSLDLIAGGRLATGVKKLWVLISPEDESAVARVTKSTDQVKVFSIEWSGFG